MWNPLTTIYQRSPASARWKNLMNEMLDEKDKSWLIDWFLCLNGNSDEDFIFWLTYLRPVLFCVSCGH
jgi:hypothetical protein